MHRFINMRGEGETRRESRRRKEYISHRWQTGNRYFCLSSKICQQFFVCKYVEMTWEIFELKLFSCFFFNIKTQEAFGVPYLIHICFIVASGQVLLACQYLIEKRKGKRNRREKSGRRRRGKKYSANTQKRSKYIQYYPTCMIQIFSL